MLKALLLLGLIQLAFTQIRTGSDSADPPAMMADTVSKIASIRGCPDCFVTQICGPYYWTRWLNRDSPTGTGDWELVSGLVSLGGCPNPIYIECQTVNGGIPWWKTGNVVRFSTSGGCVCVNAENPSIPCQNYQVRELCPL